MKPIDFLNYSNLSVEDSQIFLGARLNYFINKSGLKIFGKKRLLCTYEGNLLKIDENNLLIINKYITYLLNLIGSNLNEWEKRSIFEVHSSLQSETAHEFFLFNLFTAITNYKNKILSKKYPKILQGVNAGKSSYNLHHILKSIEKDKGELKFKVNGKLVPEKHLYTAAIFYVINFAFEAVKSGDTQRLSRILISIDDLNSGPSYLLANAKKGGIESGKARNRSKDKARQLFDKYDIYKKCGAKHEAMVSVLIPILKRNKISISEKTLKTDWIPEFSKNYS